MNPANLDKLSPTEAGQKYVSALGGAKQVLTLAKQAYSSGEYRWGAELLNHLVFAEPTNQDAKLLQADMFEQMGYQAESAGWRNTYLAAAWELRNGLPKKAAATKAGPDMISAMSTELLFDFLGVKLNAQKAMDKTLTINFVLPDRNEKFLLELKNAHLNNIKDIQSANPDVTVTVNRKDLDLMLMKVASFQQLVEQKKMTFQGNPKAFGSLLMMLEEFPFWFNIVTP